MPGERHRHGAVVVEVHRQRVAGLLAEREGDARRGRRDDQVDLLEGLGEVLGDLRAHALGVAVVGVVVAGGERVGAEHDAPLDLRPEAVVAGAGVHLEQVLGALGAQPVADAVVAGEVGRCLRGGEHVVGRQRVRGVREVHLADARAELLGTRQGGVEALEDAGFDALAGELAGHAQGDAVEPLGRGQLQLRGRLQGGGVARVARDHVAQQQGGVGDVAGQRPGLVERGGEGDHPVARDGPVGRFQPDDAAQRGRLADRAAGVRAERPRGQAGGDRRGAAARGPARARACGPTGCSVGP